MPAFVFEPTEILPTLIRLANEWDQSWRFTKKGDKRPAYDVEAGRQATKRNRRIRQEAATERSLAATRMRRARPAGEDIASRMLKAMQPEAWYGMGDLMRMAGEVRSSRAKVHQTLVARGWVEKVRNPLWSGEVLNPQKIQAGAEPQPQHLYRLTRNGLERRAALVGTLKPA